MNQPLATRRTLPRRFGPGSAGLMLTPEEFDAYPEDAWREGFRYELIDGVLVVSAYPGPGERSPNEELGYLLLIDKGTNPEGAALDDTLPEQTIYATSQRRRADRAIWTGLGRQPDEQADPPTIVVEFVSARKRDVLRDYQTKRDEYLAAGIRESWIIDRFRRTLTVHRPGPSGPVTLVVNEGDTYETPLLPGFILPLARLLARADAWQRRPRPGPMKGTNP